MELCLQNPSGTSKKFPQFDSVTDASDHTYVNSNNTLLTTTNTPFHKTIMKEWKILKKNLPPSIYVRTYENRIDLLRAVIVGASGTPYHDGLFFFDFFFSPQYPNKPPYVHYKSFGLRVNPNLYSNGRICLSILNTWVGPSWQPNESTVLQVLVSLQGLVLNEKPYYNEPMLIPPIFDRLSRKYNEDVFVLSCKTMVHLLRRPPKNFEEFVVGHFRDRARIILAACKAYMNGFVIVGEYRDCGEFLFDQKVKVSRNFSSLMRDQYCRLFNSFVKNDSSLREFCTELDQLVQISEMRILEKAMSKEKKFMSTLSGIVSGLFWCVKGIADS